MYQRRWGAAGSGEKDHYLTGHGLYTTIRPILTPGSLSPIRRHVQLPIKHVHFCGVALSHVPHCHMYHNHLEGENLILQLGDWLGLLET